MKMCRCFGGAACAGLALVAVLGVIKPAKADTIVWDFTVFGTAVQNGSSFNGITTSSVADFNPVVGTLTGVTLFFNGVAILSGSTDGGGAQFDHVTPASDVNESIFSGSGFQIGDGGFSISANGTISDAFDLSFFEGTGTQALVFDFLVDDGTVIVPGHSNGDLMIFRQTGSLTYDYTPTSPAAPEPATWAMMLVGFAGLRYAGHRKARQAAVASA